MRARFLAISFFLLKAWSLDLDMNQNVAITIGESDGHAIHHVNVGYLNAPVFLPDRLNANVGDRIKFKFSNENHTLTESSLEEPCTSIREFDTGFGQLNPHYNDGIVLTLTVTSPDSQWFFCKQNIPISHCHDGMVFALNPGSKMNRFLDNAKRSYDENRQHHPSLRESLSPAVASKTFAGTAISSSTISRTPTGQSVAVRSKSVSPTTVAGATKSPSKVGRASRHASKAASDGAIFVSPVTPARTITVTQTQTAPCIVSASASAMSVRRSSPAPATSQGYKSALVSLGSAFLFASVAGIFAL